VKIYLGTVADIGLYDDSFETGSLSFLILVRVTHFKKNNCRFPRVTPESKFFPP